MVVAQLFLPITIIACVIGVMIYLSCNSKPKEKTGDQWYEEYKASCIVPEWMEKLNEHPLKEGDKIVCIRYGLYGMTGRVKQIVWFPVLISGECNRRQSGLYIDWDSESDILPEYINRCHAIRIDFFKKKKK